MSALRTLGQNAPRIFLRDASPARAHAFPVLGLALQHIWYGLAHPCRPLFLTRLRTLRPDEATVSAICNRNSTLTPCPSSPTPRAVFARSSPAPFSCSKTPGPPGSFGQIVCRASGLVRPDPRPDSRPDRPGVGGETPNHSNLCAAGAPPNPGVSIGRKSAIGCARSVSRVAT